MTNSPETPTPDSSRDSTTTDRGRRTAARPSAADGTLSTPAPSTGWSSRAPRTGSRSRRASGTRSRASTCGCSSSRGLVPRGRRRGDCSCSTLGPAPDVGLDPRRHHDASSWLDARDPAAAGARDRLPAARGRPRLPPRHPVAALRRRALRAHAARRHHARPARPRLRHRPAEVRHRGRGDRRRRSPGSSRRRPRRCATTSSPSPRAAGPGYDRPAPAEAAAARPGAASPAPRPAATSPPPQSWCARRSATASGTGCTRSRRCCAAGCSSSSWSASSSRTCAIASSSSSCPGFAPDVAVEELEEFEGSGDPIDFIIANNLYLVAVLAVLGVAARCSSAIFYLSWRFHTFRITGDDVEVRSGILFRTQRRAPLDRVQGVNLTRPMVARLLGMAKLEVVGRGRRRERQARVPLHGERRGRARRHPAARLRPRASPRPRPAPARRAARVAGRARSARPSSRGITGLIEGDEAPVAVPESVVHIPVGRLVASHIVSPATVVLVLAHRSAIVVGVVAGRHRGCSSASSPPSSASARTGCARSSRSLRYSIAPTPDGVRITFGLLTTVTEIVPPGRVHAVEVTQPILWRPAGWWTDPHQPADGPQRHRLEHRPVHDRAAGRHARRRRARAAAGPAGRARGGVAAHRPAGHVRPRGRTTPSRTPRGARGSSGRCRGAATASASPHDVLLLRRGRHLAQARASSRSRACRASRCTRARRSDAARGHRRGRTTSSGPVWRTLAAIDRDAALRPVRGRRAPARCARHRRRSLRIAGREEPRRRVEPRREARPRRTPRRRHHRRRPGRTGDRRRARPARGTRSSGITHGSDDARVEAMLPGRAAARRARGGAPQRTRGDRRAARPARPARAGLAESARGSRASSCCTPIPPTARRPRAPPPRGARSRSPSIPRSRSPAHRSTCASSPTPTPRSPRRPPCCRSRRRSPSSSAASRSSSPRTIAPAYAEGIATAHRVLAHRSCAQADGAAARGRGAESRRVPVGARPLDASTTRSPTRRRRPGERDRLGARYDRRMISTIDGLRTRLAEARGAASRSSGGRARLHHRARSTRATSTSSASAHPGAALDIVGRAHRSSYPLRFDRRGVRLPSHAGLPTKTTSGCSSRSGVDVVLLAPRCRRAAADGRETTRSAPATSVLTATRGARAPATSTGCSPSRRSCSHLVQAGHRGLRRARSPRAPHLPPLRRAR